MTSMLKIDKTNLEATEEDLEKVRESAMVEKRRCESFSCRLVASFSSKKAEERRRDLAKAENTIKQITLNIESLERRKRGIAEIERGAMSGGLLTNKWKRGNEVRHMIESHNKQMAAEREQSRERKFGNILTRRRRG